VSIDQGVSAFDMDNNANTTISWSKQVVLEKHLVEARVFSYDL
tara:strand:- start:360 stop:488 length:129 start_codon:yes stop_codon:yes gene_type:complete